VIIDLDQGSRRVELLQYPRKKKKKSNIEMGEKGGVELCCPDNK